jgi:hypothetical protein
LALLAILSALGCGEALRRIRRGEASLALCAVPPLAGYALLEGAGSLGPGRLYLPILPFLFALGALGASRGIERLRAGWARRLAAAALVAALLLSGQAKRASTWAAFHAGDRIAGVMRGPSGEANAATDGIVVVGQSLPYIYLPGHETRVSTRAGLLASVQTGREWVLVSRFSSWFFNGFRTDFEIPVETVYRSSQPFVPIAGVESSDFQPHTNEFIYCKIAQGQIEFPAADRLYRARDFLRACGWEKDAPPGGN